MEKINRTAIILAVLAIAFAFTMINLKIQSLAGDVKVIAQFVVNECQ